MVIQLCVVQFWSEIILVISNQTRAARLFDFHFRPNCTPLSSITIIYNIARVIMGHFSTYHGCASIRFVFSCVWLRYPMVELCALVCAGCYGIFRCGWLGLSSRSCYSSFRVCSFRYEQRRVHRNPCEVAGEIYTASRFKAPRS